MGKIITATPIFLLACTLMVDNSYAQYVGPNQNSKNLNVAYVLKNPVDDQNVVLEGVILRKVSREKYIFSDGSAEIQVEIDDKKMPATQIDDKTKVQILGNVDLEIYRSPQIDVDAIFVR